MEALGNCEVTVVGSIEEATLSGQDLYIFDGITPEEYPTDGSMLLFGSENLPGGLSIDGSATAGTALTMSNKLLSDVYESLSIEVSVVSN